jgi:cysteine-rich repeat protein
MRSVVVAGVFVGALASLASAQLLGRTDLDNPVPERMALFGRAHAGVGDTVVVGAPGLMGEALPGRVHVLDGRTGAFLRSVENPTPASGDAFGAEIVTVGPDALVAAPNDDTAGADAGAAYLFDGATGALKQTFVVPGSGPGWNCGASLASVGGQPVLGCASRGAFLFDATTGALVRSFTVTLPSGFPGALATLGSDLLGTAAGKVHRFDTTTGLETQTYLAPTTWYSGALAILPDRILVGANVGGTDSVVVFDAASGAIVQEIERPDVDTTANFFGSSIAVNGNAILIGSQKTIFLFDDTYVLRQILLPTTTFQEQVGPTVSAHASGFTIARTPPKGVAGSGGVVLTDLCGNGVHADSEACDDGNVADGDGCSAACRIEVCGPAPAGGCASPAKTGAATLEMSDEYSTTGERDRFRFKWRGSGTVADFGDPTTTATHVMCLWDRVPAIPRLWMNNAIPPSGTCDGKPCWTARGARGFKLGDPRRTPAGIEKMDVRATPAGAIVSLDGRGPTVDVPAPPLSCGPDCGLPLVGTVVVQVHNLETGACWEATFVHPSRNAKRRYRARSD